MAETKHSDTKKKGNKDKLTEARDAAYGRAKSAVQGLEANPIGLLVGGVAVGLIAGAFVPRSDRERTALRPVGKRLAEGAVAALAAAKETGREQLSTSMLGKDAAKESARKVFDSVVTAAKEGGKASPAADTASGAA